MINVVIAISLLLNIFLIWYIIKLLRKFMFISENLSDLFLTTRAFQIFINSIYSMNSYHGEPVIQNLVDRIKDVDAELDRFRDIFEYTLDFELEEELRNAEEEAQAN